MPCEALWVSGQVLYKSNLLLLKFEKNGQGSRCHEVKNESSKTTVNIQDTRPPISEKDKKKIKQTNMAIIVKKDKW